MEEPHERYFGGEMRDSLYNSMQLDRNRLRDKYNEWREHPFTKNFMEYISEMERKDKDCVFEETLTDAQRLIFVTRHNLLRFIRSCSDKVYDELDYKIEAHYRDLESEEQKVEYNKALADGTEPENRLGERDNPLL